MNISIVTPSFNQGKYITEAIESVLVQNHANFEHIIVDNCSTDGTSEILAAYPHLKVICEKDQGQSDALNKGFNAAKGNIIGWLNADDKYLPGCFDRINEAFTGHFEHDLVYGDYRIIDEAGKVLVRRKELGFDLFMLKYLHVLYIPSTTTFFRRRVIEDGNFLDIQYHYAMDYEYFLRLALKGYKFYHTPVFLADFRTHAASKSQKQVQAQKHEMEQALLQQDTVLNRIQGPWRKVLRFSLMVGARLKRYILKLFIGAYFCSDK